MGVLVILSSLAIGVLFHKRWKGNLAWMTYWKLYFIGILVHVVMVALMFTLPHDNAINALRHISLPVLGFYPLATVVMGKILKDNFDRQQAHEELLIQKEKAEKSSQLKDAFIASISHEIRTPLNAILGFASIIEDEASERFTADEHIYFQRINQSGQRLTRTVDEILNYSRLLVKDINHRIVTINLPGFIEELIEETRRAHPDQSLPVVFENTLGQVSIGIDYFCIRNTLSNLLDNAIKYTESGLVNTRLFMNDSNRICISIADTGIGMSDDFLGKLFEPYSQEATGFTRRYEGLGLGLSIARKLCDIMKADITVTSKKGSGSCFTVILPLEIPITT